MPYIILALLAMAAVALLIWINTTFKISRHTLEFDTLPKEFDGFKIALMSDLHRSCFGKDNARLAEAVKELEPDMVALAGDMHTFGGKDKRYFSFLSSVTKDLPVYAVDGNHEKGKLSDYDHEKIKDTLSSIGVIHLDARESLIQKDGATVSVYGMGYPSDGIDYGERRSPFFSVALIHVPDWFDQIKDKPDLMLSGHVHGGILQIPFIGGVFAPGYGATIIERFKRKYFFPKYSKGVYADGPHRLAVSVGLGNASIQPFRFLRPEIMLLTLKSTHKGQ